MREDMMEVLITDGRRGSRTEKNYDVIKSRRRKVEEDEVGTKESMIPKDTKGWHGRKIDQKGEHLTPLKRYLRSKVGCKWDDVYSEIKKNNPSNSSVGAHVYTHLWGYVDRDVTLVNGVPNTMGYHGLAPLYIGELYICPSDRTLKECTNGQLRWGKQRIKAERLKITTVKKVGADTFVVQNKKGLWFLFEYSNRMKTVACPDYKWMKDEVTGCNVTKIVGYHDELVPYYTTVHVDRDDYEALPGLHPKSYSDPYWRHEKKNVQRYYLMGLKSLSSKEKKQYGV